MEEEEEEEGRYGKEDLKLLGARGSHQPRQTSESTNPWVASKATLRKVWPHLRE